MYLPRRLARQHDYRPLSIRIPKVRPQAMMLPLPNHNFSIVGRDHPLVPGDLNAKLSFENGHVFVLVRVEMQGWFTLRKALQVGMV